MTKAQLREAIKLEARIKSTDEWDDLVDQVVLEILTDFCNLARYDELLKERIPLTVVASQQQYSLPVDCQNIACLRFARGPVPTTGTLSYREIVAQNGNVKQTNAYGWPFYYRRVFGMKISLWPFDSILTTDSLLIDYYALPESIFSSDGDEFPIPRLEAAVKKDTIARLQRVHESNPEAQMMGQDGASSFNASRGGT